MLSSSLFINGAMLDGKNAKYEIDAAAGKDFKVFGVFCFFVLVKELQRAYSNICSESFELVEQIHLHSFELSQCLQTSQQTLPNHHAVARQRRQSRFQWEERHGRLLGETALMEARQKETSIKV